MNPYKYFLVYYKNVFITIRATSVDSAWMEILKVSDNYKDVITLEFAVLAKTIEYNSEEDMERDYHSKVVGFIPRATIVLGFDK